MKDSRADVAEVSRTQPKTVESYPRAVVCVVLLLLLSALFFNPLIELFRLTMSDPFYSHLLLIPLVGLYMVWIRRKELCDSAQASSHGQSTNSATLRGAALSMTLGILVLGCWAFASDAWKTVRVNSLSLLILSYVLFIWAVLIAILGWQRIRQFLFPVAFLVFLVPFPEFLTHRIEIFFQHASAAAASLLFHISLTPVLRDDLIFRLPGLTIQVAQECSGIRSTLVLFLTSLVAGYVFFTKAHSRWILALVVVPIAIVRNALRIFTIAMLCVHVDPGMIDSIIHHRGGPLFFALSLIPFSALLIFLYHRERRNRENSRSL